MRIFLSVLALVIIGGYSFTEGAVTGLPCANPHIATAQDVAAGYPAGHYVCPKDYTTSNVTPESGSAKEYLNNLPKRPLSQCAPPVKQNIDALDPTFATCAAQFFKEYTRQYGTVYLTSAFRDDKAGTAMNGSGQSANRCAGGVPGSNHSRGIAIDVNPARESMYPTLWQFASQNPRFGVCFPFQDGRTSGFYDRPHMILAGTGGKEAALCAAQGVTKPCDGLTFDPAAVRSPSPTGNITNALRQFTSPAGDPQSEAMCSLPDGKKVPCSAIKNAGGGAAPSGGGAAPSGQSAPPLNVQNNAAMQPGMCTPQFHCASNDLYYRTSTCVDQLYQNCANGCSGTACIASPISDALGAALSNVKMSTTSTSSASSTASAFDRIGSIANPHTTPPQTTQTTNLVITVSAEDAARLQQSQQTQHTVQLAPGTYAITPISGDTFISNDLSQSVNIFTAPAQSGLLKTLSDMKNTVLGILNYLKPFGFRGGIEQYEGE